MDYDDMLEIGWRLVHWLNGADVRIDERLEEAFVERVCQLLEPYETRERNFN